MNRNRVEMFMGNTMSNIKQDINEFAEFHEIISVSVTTDTTHRGTHGYKALVLYKA